ncbi:cap64-like protein, partial [Ceratobasidium sp. 392]
MQRRPYVRAATENEPTSSKPERSDSPPPPIMNEKSPRLGPNALSRGYYIALAVLALVFLSALAVSRDSLPLPLPKHALTNSNALRPHDYLNASASDPAPFDFCPIYGPGDELATKYGATILARTRVHAGSGARVQRVVHKALSGLPVTISVLGGSISACHGAGEDPIAPTCYPTRFFNWWNSVFPHPASELTNGALRRTDSAYFAFCSPHHLPDRTDLVILDFDAADPNLPDWADHFELLVRSILVRPDQPAVLILGHFAPQNQNEHGWAGVESLHGNVAQYYDVPHVSTKPVLYSRYLSHPDETTGTYYADPVLANPAGHVVLADVLISYFQSQICAGWAAARGHAFDAPRFTPDVKGKDLPTSKMRVSVKLGAGDVGIYFVREKRGAGVAEVACWVDDNVAGAVKISNEGSVGEPMPELMMIDRAVGAGSHFVECALGGEEESIIEYLTGTLSVPPDNIKTLFNEEATRKGILNAFRRHLIQNEKIQPGDPILVYFSGHGDQQDAPTEWHTSDGKTELILPHDAGPWDGEPEQVPSPGLGKGESESEQSACNANPKPAKYDPSKHYMHGISDRTLGALIHQLSKAKGDNIVVIFDSCHSGSGTRGHCRARFSHDPDAPPIPHDIDEELGQLPQAVLPPQSQPISVTKQESGKFVGPSQAPSLETHVLLAACKNDELAQEIPDGDQTVDESSPHSSSGLFTRALLITLRECELSTTSYSALMRSVQRHVMALIKGVPERFSGQVKVQVPQCEGRRQDRLLFRTQLALTKGMIQLDRDERAPNTFKIKAGSASGIREGTELDAFSAGHWEPIAQLVATKVTDTDATLVCSQGTADEIPPNSYVVVAKYTGYSVRILAEEELKQSEPWQEVFSELQSHPIDIIWSKPGELSDLVLVRAENGVVQLKRQDPSIVQLNPRDIALKNTASPNELTQSLGAIAHFHFHLQRQNPTSPLQGKVEMKLIELKPKSGRAWGVKDYVPINDSPEDLFSNRLSSNGMVELRATPDKRYGLQLTNTSNWPLFAWVLYFDLEDYS